MKNDTTELSQLLNAEDFHIDALGRVVIDNPELLNAINGAMHITQTDELLLNGGCSNSGCV